MVNEDYLRACRREDVAAKLDEMVDELEGLESREASTLDPVDRIELMVLRQTVAKVRDHLAQGNCPYGEDYHASGHCNYIDCRRR